MKQELTNGFIPLLSSKAGSCLTFANWEDAGINTVSYSIADLLMKPGLSVLTSLTDIRSYCKWHGVVVLNATLPPANHDDIYSIRSLYDGSLIQIDVSTLFALITQLQPDKVILPIGSANYYSQFWRLLPAVTMPYIHISDNLAGSAVTEVGRYLTSDPDIPFSCLLEQINTSHEHFYIPLYIPLYVIGDFDLRQMSQLLTYKKYLIESDKPAKDGLVGMVYSMDGLVNILEKKMAEEHQPIDSHCQCQTCSQMFTRAYLHHLLQHTPRLAERYLIQHNVYYCQNYLIY